MECHLDAVNEEGMFLAERDKMTDVRGCCVMSLADTEKLKQLYLVITLYLGL